MVCGWPAMPELLDLHPAPADVRRLVIEGLSRSPKQLPAWFLYDAEGSRLFDLICQNLGYNDWIHPVVAAWSPTILFGSLGVALFSGVKS